MREIINYFDHSFVINLPSRADMRRDVKGEFRNLGYKLEFDGSPLSQKVSLLRAVHFDGAGSFPSIGARGSTASHAAALAIAATRCSRNVLIFEDDVQFNHVLPGVTRTILAQIPEHWDVIYFGYLQPECNLKEVGLSLYSDAIIGGHFYAVNGSFFHPLSDYIRKSQSLPAGHPEGGSMGRDGAFNHMSLMHPSIRIFIASPNLATQRASRSDISPTRPDSSPLAPLVDFLRVAKNHLTALRR
jgi:glycosyl transferase, family 25